MPRHGAILTQNVDALDNGMLASKEDVTEEEQQEVDDSNAIC